MRHIFLGFRRSQAFSVRLRRLPLLWIAALTIVCSPWHTGAQITTSNFFNWETAPVHPVSLSPDNSRLAVCNLPDNHLEIFDVTGGKPVLVGSIAVGLDPVTVRFRTATELWVANYISDSISIIALPTMRVVNTIPTANEPSDIVFAGPVAGSTRAYVSCGQPNLVQVYDPASLNLVTNLVIDGNRPRAMAVSPDGSKVYVAIFESGNASTIIGTGVAPLTSFPKPSPVNFPNAPSHGLNPPPNSGTNFVPPINVTTAAPPRVSLIVKKNAAGRWMDDNQGDWTEWIRGTNAALTGRMPGWDMPDHDLAAINTSDFSIAYASGLMNICMAVAVNPASGRITVVGTDGLNSLRFQPVLNGIFIRVNLAQVNPFTLAGEVTDLNPHLNYRFPLARESVRVQSIGDPRQILWTTDGTKGYVSGMGSDNLIQIDAQGNRIGLSGTIGLDAGPTGMALDETRGRLFVYSRFAGSLSTVDTTNQVVIDEVALWDPTPAVIKAGRPHLYNTHQTSGLGQLACASCHVDSRFDRLAWDLGDPTDVMNVITNANFANNTPSVTNNYHPMKGPMTTQTLQDIIGHEPFHWRGDRTGIEQFQSTFTNLQGAVTALSSNEMQDLKGFLGTVRFAPNPFRQFDNSLATNLALPGQFALGRGALPSGAPLPNGNAQSGQLAFRLTAAFGCIPCHTLPLGAGTDMRFNGAAWTPVPLGPNAAHHAALIQIQRSMDLPFKIPQLRNMFDKTGFDLAHTNSRAGFGLFHDGSVDSLTRFIQDGFAINDDQATADLIAFLLSFTGSDLIPGATNDINRSPGLPSLDTPAAAGRQITISNSAAMPLIDSMIALANSSTGRVDLVVKGIESGLARGWYLLAGSNLFQSDRQAETETPTALRTLAAVGSEQTYMLVPRGSGKRIGIDEDGDGYLDRDELDFGSDPANPLSWPTNTPPLLTAISNVTVLKGRLLSISCVATDTDIPVQILTFSLGTNSPPGATINPTNGLFTWTPTGPAGAITNTVTVLVTDNGKPPKSATQTFTVVALDLSLSSLTVATNGTTLSWGSLPGITYRLQYKAQLTDPAWMDVPGDVSGDGLPSSKTDPAGGTNAARFYRIIALP